MAAHCHYENLKTLLIFSGVSGELKSLVLFSKFVLSTRGYRGEMVLMRET